MPGIFPQGGVGCENAFQTICDPLVVDACTPTWHAPRCVPKFDPTWANAINSEILNLMKCNELPYDCRILTNLCAATSIHEISGRQTYDYSDGGPPVDVPNGSNRLIGAGSFHIPNSFHREIGIFMFMESTVQFEQLGGDNTSSLDLDVDVNTAPDFSGATMANIIQRVRNFDPGSAQFASNPTSARGGVRIPPGGRDFYWRARTSQTGPGDWQLQYTEKALSVTIYGTSAHTRDSF